MPPAVRPTCSAGLRRGGYALRPMVVRLMEATMLNARRIAMFCLAMVPALTATNAQAAEYPVRPVKLVVPYAAGGPTDVLGRLVADFLARDLKVATVVENKAAEKIRHQ